MPKNISLRQKLSHWTYILFKRLFDFVFSLAGTLLMVFPFLVIAAIIKLDSPGPVIFRQERLGINGKPFVLYKFRSMRLDAEKDGAKWADKNDTRCTQVGRILREFRLDELPQLLNILAGDMSFVGPRPERAQFYDLFEKDVPGFRQRLSVKPGLTGLAQVNGGYELGPAKKLAWDLEYIKKRSFWMDLKIILKTAVIVFSHEGAR